MKNKSHQWVARLFVSLSLYSQYPHFVSLGLSVLANYATDFFKGSSQQGEVSLDIVVEKKKNDSYKKVLVQGACFRTGSYG